MVPIFAPGDHVLTFNWGRLAVGDVIVFEKGGKNYIKRIEKISGKLCYVSGDNRKDSALMGPVVGHRVFGKVIFKY